MFARGKSLTPVRICCLDLEGVLVPEIWIAVAKKTRIKALERTTRDEPDYNVLMRYRLKILADNSIGLKEIRRVIGRLEPLPGARRFLDRLRAAHPVVILSDTFYQFAAPLMKKLGHPTLLCNALETDARGRIRRHVMRQARGKEKAVRALKKTNLSVVAAGDSYNDLGMLKAADRGVFFKPPPAIAKKYARFPVTRDYAALFRTLTR